MKPPLLSFAVLLFSALSLSACAGRFALPGGSEAVNEACFESEEALKARLAALRPGMGEAEVLSSLCRKKEDIVRVDRRDIRIALLGGENIAFPQEDEGAIAQLYGYRMIFKSIKKRHGFESPIRIRTDETGYSYTVTLVFHGGALAALPAVSGGPVKSSSSGTLFDALTPSAIINHAMP